MERTVRWKETIDVLVKTPDDSSSHLILVFMAPEK